MNLNSEIINCSGCLILPNIFTGLGVHEVTLHTAGRLTMELNDFQKEFEAAQQSGNKIERLNFLWKLMRSPYTEYHYSLIIGKDTDNEFRNILWSRFDEHGEEAETLLISKLIKNEDVGFHADILYYLGKIADRRNTKYKKETLEYAKQFVLSSDDDLRDSAIIVLGWIGSNSELPLLVDRLLHDTNSKCRAWAAASFMQMNFRLKRQGSFVSEEIVFPALRQAIADEKDYFSLGTHIISLQEIAGKKWLSNTAAENVDVEKIEKAKKSAVNFLEKWEEINSVN